MAYVMGKFGVVQTAFLHIASHIHLASAMLGWTLQVHVSFKRVHKHIVAIVARCTVLKVREGIHYLFAGVLLFF